MFHRQFEDKTSQANSHRRTGMGTVEVEGTRCQRASLRAGVRFLIPERAENAELEGAGVGLIGED